MPKTNAELLTGLAEASETQGSSLLVLAAAYDETAIATCPELPSVEGCEKESADELARRLIAAADAARVLRCALESLAAQTSLVVDEIRERPYR